MRNELLLIYITNVLKYIGTHTNFDTIFFNQELKYFVL